MFKKDNIPALIVTGMFIFYVVLVILENRK